MKEQNVAAFGLGALLGFVAGKLKSKGGGGGAPRFITVVVRLDNNGDVVGSVGDIVADREDRVRWVIVRTGGPAHLNVEMRVRAPTVAGAPENPFGFNPRKRVPRDVPRPVERFIGAVVRTDMFDDVEPGVPVVQYKYDIYVDGVLRLDPVIVIHR